jgi:LysR family transcriptional regulator, glycine cleavage system transcriptional activator
MSTTETRRQSASIIRGLQYFEAVARHQSVRVAAEELGVSQSAVSHQIRELARVLGEQLLIRSGRGIAVSPVGQLLAERLSTTFSSLQASLDEIVGGESRQILRLAVCSSFGPGWVVPRLPGFIEANPGIDLQLQLYAQDPQLSHQVADAIFSALPVTPGFSAIHVLDEMLVAVHAPGAHNGRHRMITTDLEPQKLGQDWLNYCAQTGIGREIMQEGAWLRSTHYMLALEMARAGMGAALVPDFLARRHIEDGTLAYLDRTRIPSGRVYRLCFKQSRGRETGIRALVKWLRAELSPDSRLSPAVTA